MILSGFNINVWRSIKVLLTIITVSYVVYTLASSSKPVSLQNGFFAYEPVTVFLMLVVLLAMLLNWSLEICKWRFLYGKVHSIDFGQAFKGVVAGCAISLWTPNRTGDYLGRIMYIPGRSYGKAICSSILGNAAQFVVTLLAGCTGMVYYLLYITQDTYSEAFVWIPLLTLSITLFVYLASGQLLKMLSELTYRFKVHRYLMVLYRYTTADRLFILLLSSARFTVFLGQYFLLLWAFQVELPLISGISLICLIFMVQSLMPGFVITEAGTRGATALYFIGQLSANSAGILLAAYYLWLINIILPAIIGTVYVIKAGALSTPRWMTASVRFFLPSATRT